MLSEEEQKALSTILSPKDSTQSTNENQQDKKTNPLAQNVNGVYLFLSAIMYFNDQKWTVWINDQPLSDLSTRIPSFLLKKVSPHSVTLTSSNQPGTEITLRPNQTYILDRNKLIDGDGRPKAPLAKP